MSDASSRDTDLGWTTHAHAPTRAAATAPEDELPTLSRPPAQQRDGQLRTRIIREAQALARVSSANVVHVYEVGEYAEQQFIFFLLATKVLLRGQQWVNGLIFSSHWKADAELRPG